MNNPYAPDPSMQPQMQEVPVSSDELYATQIQEERVQNFISQISPDNQLMEIQWRIKGYVKDPLTHQWIKIDKNTPEPSPLLVSRFIAYLSSILNQNTVISNFDEREINNIMKITIEYLIDDIDAHADEYGLGDNYSERTRILQIVSNTVFSVFKRALHGSESRRLFSSLNMSESNSMNPQAGKKGLADQFKFWK